jgi:NAD(P)-dependent dehydrogenase (short-subunit alcohol dehydrogenase family)
VTEKRVIISGASSGIGKQTAIELAKRGAHVVMVCRSRERGEAAREDIRAASGSETIDLMLCDMAGLGSIRAFADEYHAKYDRLDVLVNNAGAMFGKRELTADGYEMTFAVNHLAYFLVTNLLLDVLRASAPARIVSVASAGHRMGWLDFDNLQGEKMYQRYVAYGTSKLCNIMFTYELARRLEGTGVTANCLHPGAVGSNFGAGSGALFESIMKLGKPLLMSSEDGARTSIYLASSPDVDGVTGKYFTKCKPVRSSRKSYDRAAQARLWELSEALTAGP